ASGNQATVTMNYTPYTVQTNFGCSGITEYGATSQNLVSSISLPDTTSYTITYEVTPGDSHNPHYVTGRVASLQLPTGGTISYAYSGGSNGITCADGSTATLARTTPDGTWTYAQTQNGAASTTTLTDPQSNVTTYNFQGIYETERQVGSLETIYTCYNGASFPCNSTSITLPIAQRTVTTSIGGLESQVNTDYNSYGLPTEVDEYDWGPTLARKTMISYDYNTSCGVTNGAVVNLPCVVQVTNGGGALEAQTTNTYDKNGNLEIQTVNTSSSTHISRAFTYSSYGVQTSATDYNDNVTTYSNFICANNTAFPQSVTSGGLTATLAWDCNAAVVTSVTDANGQATTYAHNDPFWRLTEITYPDKGQTNISYTDSANGFSVETSRLLSTGVNHQVTQYLDGLGRVDKTLDSQ